MGGPARVLGWSSGVLGLAWGVMGGAWCVLGVAWSVLGSPWEVLERPSRRLWGSLEVLGGLLGRSQEVLERPLGVFEGPWGSLGRSSGGPRGSLGEAGRLPRQTMFFQSISGGSWRPLGVFLVLWGGPWVRPGRSECCCFIDNSDVLGVQGFSLTFC